MSYATTREVATFFRKATGNRHFFEPMLKEQLLERSKTLKNYFTEQTFQFVKIKIDVQEETPNIAAFCKNIEGLIAEIKETRKAEDVSSFFTHI